LHGGDYSRLPSSMFLVDFTNERRIGENQAGYGYIRPD
jgi:hypothetical protein